MLPTLSVCVCVCVWLVHSDIGQAEMETVCLGFLLFDCGDLMFNRRNMRLCEWSTFCAFRRSLGHFRASRDFVIHTYFGCICSAWMLEMSV